MLVEFTRPIPPRCPAVRLSPDPRSQIINVVVHKFVPEDAHFSREMQSEFWSDFALVCEAVILAWMHRDAYPWKELDDKDGKRKRRMEEAKQLALIRSALPEHHHKDPEGGKPHHVRNICFLAAQEDLRSSRARISLNPACP